MALDEALLGAAVEPLLRTYRWERPAVSFGYFGRFASVAAAWPGRECVRRITGGGAVPHGDDVTYSLIVPAGHPFAGWKAQAIYRAVHETLGRILAAASAVAELAGARIGPGTGACFESPVEFDLLADGRKIAGAAMKRTREGLLIQGSIQHTAGLDQIAPRLATAFANTVNRRAISPDIRAKADVLVRMKYGSAAWNERV
jgi:lipoate-protein ligase A